MRGAGAPGSGESLSAREKLRRRADYTRCYRKGRRRHGTFWVLHWIGNGLEHPRLGITASRKVGGAVVRTRIKRRIREIYRRWPQRRRLPPLDLVVHVKPTAARLSFPEAKAELEGMLEQLLPRAHRAGS